MDKILVLLFIEKLLSSALLLIFTQFVILEDLSVLGLVLSRVKGLGLKQNQRNKDRDKMH